MREWIAGAMLVATLTTATAAPTPAQIDKAKERAVAYLKRIAQPDGSFDPKLAKPLLQVGGNRLRVNGVSAACAYALLEAGVPADDPIITRTATLIRATAGACNQTYETPLLLLFLDKLGTPEDVALIRRIGLKLLASQGSDGTWSYTLGIDQAQADRQQNARKERTIKAAKPAIAPERLAKLDVEMREQALAILEGRRSAKPANGDNSCTQFGLIALWIACRHGIPGQEALARTEKHFRSTQAKLGTWGYKADRVFAGLSGVGMAANSQMTCAGLLGIAYGFGGKVDLRAFDPKAKGQPGLKWNLRDDKAMRTGINAVANFMQKDSFADMGGTGKVGLYGLWSLERTALILGLRKIGKYDWYDWCALHLLQMQHADGHWDYSFGGPALGTAWGLMILCKANVARDLTVKIAKAGGEVQMAANDTGRLTDEPDEAAADQPPSKPADGMPPTPAVADDASGTLAERLVAARGADADALIKTYTTTKGVIYTDALAQALPKLAGDMQQAARDALVERLMRMTANTLRDKLKDDNAEIRRAAALACGTHADKAFIADLIAAVTDADAKVARAAGVALKAITGQNFGPSANATAAERTQAQQAWQQWHKRELEKNRPRKAERGT